MKLLVPAAALLLTLPALHAQGAKASATLLGQFDPPGETYNDVWGYAAPNGKEYAILGATDGTFIVDCTDPTHPTQRAFIPASASGWGASTWRDMRSYGSYVYVVTEGGGGMQIIDMTNPDSPVLAKTWGQSIWPNAHNVAIDLGTGTLYACGTNVGMPIVDLSKDPLNPTLITTFRNPYVHDLAIQDGYAHLAAINSSAYLIIDVSNLPSTPTLAQKPVQSCHNAWPSRDDQIAVTTSETFGGGLTVFDISNKRLPVQVSTFRTGGSTTSIHNAYLRDRVAHMSYYSEGYRAVDLSDPAKPVQVAFYDTSASTGGFAGDWGCYPFQPSGVIYASDFDNGLLVIDTPAATRLYGSATAGAGGTAPQIHTFGCAYRGNGKFAFELEGAAPQAAAALLIGVAQGSSTVAGAQVQVDLTQAFGVAPVRTDASGKARVALPIAPDAKPVTLYAQWVVADAQAPGGFAASRGMEFEVFYNQDK